MVDCTTTVHGAGINTSNCSKANNEGNYTFPGFAELKPATAFGCPGLRLFLDGVDQGEDYTFFPDAYILSTTCIPPGTETQYDCINGACIPKSTYNSPGLYASLSDCQVACGTGCSGKCLSNSDWAQIEGLANQLKSRNCS